MIRALCKHAALPRPMEAMKAAFTWPKFSLTSYRIACALRALKVKPKTIIDIGANVGQFAIACHFILEGPVIHCFEPLPQSFDKLTMNIAGMAKTRSYPLGLGAQDTTLDFHVNRDTRSSSFRRLGAVHRAAFPGAREIEKLAVPVRRLDSVFDGKELEGPVLLKLDVQGFESEVLMGAEQLLTKIDYLLVETSLVPLYEEEMTFRSIQGLVENHGFSMVRPLDFLSDPRTGLVLQMDVLFSRSKHLL